jgi:hypothetical protein
MFNIKKINKINRDISSIEDTVNVLLENILKKCSIDEVNKLKEKVDKIENTLLYDDLRSELQRMSLTLRAIVNYLDIEFKEDWIEDMRYMKPEIRKIMTLKAVKKNETHQ